MPCQPDGALRRTDLHQKEGEPRREITFDAVRDDLTAGIDDFHVTAFIILDGSVSPGVLRDALDEVAKRVLGAHAGIVRQAEFVAADIRLDNRRVVADDFDKQNAYARGFTRVADGFSPRRLRVRCVVDADLTALAKPVEQIPEGAHGEAFAFLAGRLIVRRKVARGLLGARSRAAVVSDVNPKRPVTQPGEIPLKLAGDEGFPAGRQADHHNRKLLHSGSLRNHSHHLTKTAVDVKSAANGCRV